jgi:N-acetylmuramoyl-L-alanine amidase
MQLLRRGDSGPAVAEIRAKLEQFGLLGKVPAESVGHFDRAVEQAVRAFQQQRGLITDGIVGPATYRALREAGWRLGDRMLALLISTPMSGDDVLALQEQLLELGYDTGRPTGVFDEQTERGLRAFQRDYCDVPDGVCGPATLRALLQLNARRVKGGRPHLLREQELLR